METFVAKHICLRAHGAIPFNCTTESLILCLLSHGGVAVEIKVKPKNRMLVLQVENKQKEQILSWEKKDPFQIQMFSLVKSKQKEGQNKHMTP